MAIIKTLLLQVFMLLAFIGSVQGTTTPPTLSAVVDGTPQASSYEVKDGMCDKTLDLKCTTQTPTEYLAFEKDEVVQGPYVVGPSSTGVIENKFTAGAVDASAHGVWKCLAATDAHGTGKSAPSAVAITVNCPKCGAANPCTDPLLECVDDGGKKCKCRHGKSDASYDPASPDTTKCKICKEAASGTDDGCESAKPHCDTAADGGRGECKVAPTSVATSGTTGSGTRQTNPAHQTTGSGTKPTTGVSNATPTTPKPSSAGKVTSTACLVIASVVLALMI